MKDSKLIFVYNAQSGVLNSVSNYARKTFSPDSYECALGMTTHGPIGMLGEWKEYVRKLDIPTEFIRRDEVAQKYPKALYKEYPKSISYPCVLIRRKDSLQVFITTEELKTAPTVEELMDLVTQKLMVLKK